MFYFNKRTIKEVLGVIFSHKVWRSNLEKTFLLIEILCIVLEIQVDDQVVEAFVVLENEFIVIENSLAVLARA